MLPTNADLLYEEEHWEMPIEEMPGWRLHFVVCLKRRAKKVIRKRVTLLYLKMAFIAVVSMIIGAMQAATQSDTNMLAMLYMLFSRPVTRSVISLSSWIDQVFSITGRVLCLFAANATPVDAMEWLLQRLGVSAKHRRVIVEDFLALTACRCRRARV